MSEHPTALAAPPAKRLPFGSLAVILANGLALSFSADLCVSYWKGCNPNRFAFDPSTGSIGDFGYGLGFLVLQGAILLILAPVNSGYLAFSLIKIFKNGNWWRFALLAGFALAWAGLFAINNAHSCVTFRPLRRDADIRMERASSSKPLFLTVQAPAELNFPALRLHQLKGDLAGHWSVWVNGNWHVTFRFIGSDVELVDYQDYH